MIDDEEADPEYNILEDEEEFDAEELRADRTVQITKKEVSELLSEFFEEDFSCADNEIGMRDLLSPAEDILQSAFDVIDDLPLPVSPGYQKCSKPTGIVLPTPVTQSNSDLTVTLSFPISNYSPVELKGSANTLSFAQEIAFSSDVFLPRESNLLLQEQMRKHVQLLTQMHLITAQQPELSTVTEECRNMLLELTTSASTVDIANLHEAIDLTGHWETITTAMPIDNYRKYQRNVVSEGYASYFTCYLT